MGYNSDDISALALVQIRYCTFKIAVTVTIKIIESHIFTNYKPVDSFQVSTAVSNN